jgi:hypothetical protein
MRVGGLTPSAVEFEGPTFRKGRERWGTPRFRGVRQQIPRYARNDNCCFGERVTCRADTLVRRL